MAERAGAVVLLARHGSHAEVGRILSGRSGIALSAAGRDEAARLARRLEGAGLAAVYSSPRARAHETAAAVAVRCGLPVATADALDEIDFGAWAGRSFAALAGDPAWTRWNTARATTSPPGGEGMAAAVGRARTFLDGLDGTAGPVLCVSHADVIRGLVAFYLGLDMDHLLRFDCDPASLTTLALDGAGGGRLLTLNERPA